MAHKPTLKKRNQKLTMKQCTAIHRLKYGSCGHTVEVCDHAAKLQQNKPPSRITTTCSGDLVLSADRWRLEMFHVVNTVEINNSRHSDGKH
jgi:hypothetical protein